MAYIGIDLGTSSCSVAMMIDGEPQVLSVFEGYDEMPTYVSFLEDGTRLIGLPAKRQALLNPENTIFTIKRLIGRKYATSETQKELGLLPYKTFPSSAGYLWVEARGKAYTPTEITAIMLKEVKHATERFLNAQIKGAVITVPAYFDESQLQATRTAAKIAGINILDLIAEPVAAALAARSNPNDRGTVAVYDLGGGTFDVSILDTGDGVFEVRSIAGDNRLGGEDFDHELVKHFSQKINSAFDISVERDPIALHRLKDAAEQIKRDLDSRLKVTFDLPYLAVRGTEIINYTLELTRAEMNEIFHGLVSRTLEPCRSALKNAKFSPNNIGTVVLVGGMSRMPLIRDTVTELFGREPAPGQNPSRIVALGAALHGAVLSGEKKDNLLLNVIPMSLGIFTRTGKFLPIVERNTTIPTKKSVRLEDESEIEQLIEKGEVQFFQAINDSGSDSLFIGKVNIPGKNFFATEIARKNSFEITIDIDNISRIRASLERALSRRKFTEDAWLGVGDPFSRGYSGFDEIIKLAALRAHAEELLRGSVESAREDLTEKGATEIAVVQCASTELQRAMQSRDSVELTGAIESFASVANESRYEGNVPTVEIERPLSIQATQPSNLIFISYAREDKKWLDMLRPFLIPLERQGRVEVWHDGRIDAGHEWRGEIERALSRSKAAILLISSNFMASSFIYDHELPPVLERVRTVSLQLVPLLVGYCLYDQDPDLSQLNAFNDPGRPLSSMADSEIQAELTRLARHIGNLYQGV
jgi:molecular chaperone DnaK